MRRRGLGMAGLGAALVFAAMPARGEIVLTAVQNGSGVVVSGRGTADTTDLQFVTDSTSPSGVIPGEASLLVGPAGSALDVGAYVGQSNGSALSGPPFFGVGTEAGATSGSGDAFGAAIEFGTTILVLPKGYASLDLLEGSATFAGATFASLGMTPGTYAWTWGAGDHADSMVLTVVPEPSGLTMAAIAAGLGVWSSRRRRGRAATV